MASSDADTTTSLSPWSLTAVTCSRFGRKGQLGDHSGSFGGCLKITHLFLIISMDLGFRCWNICEILKMFKDVIKTFVGSLTCISTHLLGVANHCLHLLLLLGIVQNHLRWLATCHETHHYGQLAQRAAWQSTPPVTILFASASRWANLARVAASSSPVTKGNQQASRKLHIYIYIYTLTNLLCNSKMEHSAVVFCLALWTSTQSTPAAVLWWNVSCDWAHFNLQMVFERNWGNVAKVRQDDLFTSSNGLRSGNLRLDCRSGSLPWCKGMGVIPLLSLRFPKLRRRSKAQLKSRFLWGRYRLAEILDSLHFYVQRGTYASELVHSSPIRSSTGF